MSHEWKPSTQTLGGLPCLEHRITKELAAHGTGGQLFEVAPGKVVALIYQASGEETMVKVKDVKAMAKRLGIRASLGEQLLAVR